MAKIVVLLFVAAFAFAQQPPAPAPKPAAPKAAAPTSATPAAPKSATSADADPVVLTVGTETITKSQFEKLIEQAQQPGQPRPALTPDARRRYAENIAELKILAQEARKRHMEQNPEVQFQIKLRTDQVLAYTMFQQINANLKADDASRHAFYEAHKNDYETVTAKHILIRFKDSKVPLREGEPDRTDAEALAHTQEIRAKVVAGGDFAALAKAESDDTGSGANGGELGDFKRGSMVPQFEEAAFAAKVGEVTQPVKTQFGYHLILVSKHESKTYEEVAPQIDEQLKPELGQKAVEDLKKDVPVKFDQDYFGR